MTRSFAGALRLVVVAGLFSGLLLTLLSTVGGCGFHLRTWDLAAGMESFYVDAPSSNLLAAPLRRALRQAGVTEAGSADDAEVVVGLLDGRRGVRNVSVTSTARVAEHELSLGVRYRILDGSGAELIAPRWARSRRVYQVDRDNVVGSSEEQALLEREMRTDLIEQIVRTLNAVSESANAS